MFSLSRSVVALEPSVAKANRKPNFNQAAATIVMSFVVKDFSVTFLRRKVILELAECMMMRNDRA